MRGPDGNAVLCCQLGDGWQLIACAQRASQNLLAQVGGDDLVCSARRRRRWYWHGHDSGHRCRRSTVRFVNPTRVDPERSSAPASVSETSGDRAHIDAGGDELGRRVVTQRVQAGAPQPELDRQPAVAAAQRAWPER